MNLIDAIVIMMSLVLIIYMFVRLRRKGQASGASMFMITQGATDAFLDHDKKQATEVIVERNAGKKMEEQSVSGDNNDKIELQDPSDEQDDNVK